MRDKAKRKHDTTSLFKLKLTLIAFIIGTVIATFFPMIWLAPPFFKLTPFVYIGVSLLWIPIVWRVLRWVMWDNMVKVLMIGCLLSSILISVSFHPLLTTYTSCWKGDAETLLCTRITYNDGGCRFNFSVIQIGKILVAKHNPMFSPDICDWGF